MSEYQVNTPKYTSLEYRNVPRHQQNILKVIYSSNCKATIINFDKYCDQLILEMKIYELYLRVPEQYIKFFLISIIAHTYPIKKFSSLRIIITSAGPSIKKTFHYTLSRSHLAHLKAKPVADRWCRAYPHIKLVSLFFLVYFGG